MSLNTATPLNPLFSALMTPASDTQDSLRPLPETGFADLFQSFHVPMQDGPGRVTAERGLLPDQMETGASLPQSLERLLAFVRQWMRLTAEDGGDAAVEGAALKGEAEATAAPKAWENDQPERLLLTEMLWQLSQMREQLAVAAHPGDEASRFDGRAVSGLKDGIEHENVDRLDPLMAIVSDIMRDMSAEAAKTAGEQSGGVDALKLPRTSVELLERLEKVLRQRLSQLRPAEGEAEKPGAARTESVEAGREMLVGRLVESEAGQASLKPSTLKTIRQQVQALLKRLEAAGQASAPAALARTSGQRVSADVPDMSRVLNTEGETAPWPQPSAPAVQVLHLVQREGNGAVPARSDAPQAVQTDMASRLQTEANAEDHGALSRGGGERANPSSVSGRADMGIQLPLRHPQWGEQLAQRVMLLARNGQQLAQIRLNPAHLGPVQIKLKLDAESGVQVSLHAHHALTREAIEQALPRMRELFQQQGLTLGDVSVQPDERGQAQAFADARREQAHAAAHSNMRRPLSDMAVGEDEVSHEVVLRADGLIDHFV